MYLKNVAKTGCVIINTVVGKIGISAGEVIDLKHRLLPPVSPNIKQATEEEYRKFCNPEETLEDTNVNIQEAQTIITAINQINDDVNNGKELTAENITDGIKDDGAADFLKKLFVFNTLDKQEEKEEEKEPDFSSVGTNTNAKPLTVQKTDSSSELNELETQLEELRQAWKDAKQVRKKDKIHKQIKEVQKQIDKLKKDLDA